MGFAKSSYWKIELHPMALAKVEGQTDEYRSLRIVNGVSLEWFISHQ
jgi:hypothetical protein